MTGNMTTRIRMLAALGLAACGLAGFGRPPEARAQGTTFTVTVAQKTAEHPYFQQGWPEGYVVDGVQGRRLTLVRGRTYTFRMSDVPLLHPFYLSTSESGAGAGVYAEGVTGNFAAGDETLTFTPGPGTPDVLYYQCGSHAFMGARLDVVSAETPALRLVAEGLTSPVVLAEPPDGTGRLFVGDQAGRIWIVMPDGTRPAEPFLDLRDRMVQQNPGFDERGLLGLAFHPEYDSNGRFFVYYSAPLRAGGPAGFNHTSHLSEFQLSGADVNRADPNSEKLLLQVDQPQFNHNAGDIAFGPADGYLYVALGDGGGGNDNQTGHVDDWYADNAGGNGQDVTQNLLGSILRLDVDNPAQGMNYGIPPDNPFVGRDGLDEQWAYGFRNPYRISFDRGGDHMLLAADAGQELWEEVSVVTKGGNYGWNVREGTHCFDAENPTVPAAGCPDTDPEGDPLIDPVIEFANSKQQEGLGLAVVGGYVYRGSELPELSGRYVFGIWSRGNAPGGGRLPGAVYTAAPQAGGPWPFEELDAANETGRPLGFVLGFGQDQAGELYVMASDSVGPAGASGRVYRLVRAGSGTPVEPGGELPRVLALEQNYPNPFNPATTLRFHTARQADVSVVVYDLTGRAVRRLLERPLPPGTHAVEWDGADDAGRPVASGTYLYRVTAGEESDVRAMTILK